MDRFTEAKRTKRITIYADTPESVSRSVEAYNREMTECRAESKRMKLLEEAFVITDPLLTGVFSAAEAEKVFEKPALGAGILLAYAAAFILLALVKKNYIAAAAFSALLLILDLRFAIPLAFNISIAAAYSIRDKRLKKHDGYPAFLDIQMTFDRGTEPQENKGEKI
ncbi:hypothetical protein SAMN02910447_02157 [Ruminococcus sp. YE71]|uniref:hypothetical protein n=1 Tax=unclassified Ruminococcus TaxID=2608920 RepID=UPI0008846444|nr:MULTISPECIES: hypothetical protein [unclassified Ruminococcus]SDA22141.1 hypothetical protein SAMN02910446_02026 [Ruminococcus sp. YE78]SFW37527.1 hypothetical protein SAMN02910447_02157 [Ruminococcus sp. YE71]